MSSALEMIKTAYGSAPTRLYFERLLDGGREGTERRAAVPEPVRRRHLASPALHMVAIGRRVPEQHAHDLAEPEPHFTPPRWRCLSNAVLAACDSLDGIVDGVVSNPAAALDAASARQRAALRRAAPMPATPACPTPSSQW